MYRCYTHAGIPETYAAFDPDKIEKDGRAESLWTAVNERVKTQGGRGLLLSGSQGTGKSLALWMLARSEIKRHLIESGERESRGFQSVPFVCKRFKHWLRDEFCPSQDGRRNWNFEQRHDMLAARAIFLDDLTLDPSVDTFRPVREFLDLVIDDLITMIDGPRLYITTNNTAEDWTKLLGAQLVDRIAGKDGGLCEIIQCKWKSYR